MKKQVASGSEFITLYETVDEVEFIQRIDKVREFITRNDDVLRVQYAVPETAINNPEIK